MEARCYGLAKRYHPFQVNTVVGFIGPEYLYDARQITRAGLEDHFMGKLTGIPMGVRRLLHQPRQRRPERDREPGGAADRRRLQLFHGRARWATISMLSYQCTSYHDAPSLRQLLELRPLPEFERWMEELGLMKHGRLTDRAGDASFFLQR